MPNGIPEKGGVNRELFALIHMWWLAAAAKTGVDVNDFNPEAPLAERLAWAVRKGFEIGVMYCRESTKFQDSLGDQARSNVEDAASKMIYVPPEYTCSDQGVSGRKIRRAGLNRMREILRQRLATVLVVFSASRLFRQAFRGFQLIQEEVVEAGLRAIAVSQNVDTANEKTWKLQFQAIGMADELLIDATSEHVRAGQTGLFLQGYPTGAIAVGYRQVEDASAPKTNRGLVRTVPEVDPAVAAKIREHYKLIVDGLPIQKGWLLWRAEGLPADPRSPSNAMSYSAYRRMLSREAYVGRWKYGETRSVYSSTKDYIVQNEQPEDDVAVEQREHLRIVSDELFHAVQEILARHEKGPRGPRANKQVHAWDVLVDLFICAECGERFYQSGANGGSMSCKNGAACRCRVTVNRRRAVQALLETMAELVKQDAPLVEEVILETQRQFADGGTSLEEIIASKQQRVGSLDRQVRDLLDLAGTGSEEDRKETLDRARVAQAERNSERSELARYQQLHADATREVSREDIREAITDLASMLNAASKGQLGEEAVYKVAQFVRAVACGGVKVYVEPRPGRKQKNVRGVFRPSLITAVSDELRLMTDGLNHDRGEVSVWLREPPRVDLMAPRAHELIDEQGWSFRQAARQLREEGFDVNSGNVWYAYQRWYEMQGQEPPEQPRDSD